VGRVVGEGMYVLGLQSFTIAAGWRTFRDFSDFRDFCFYFREKTSWYSECMCFQRFFHLLIKFSDFFLDCVLHPATGLLNEGKDDENTCVCVGV
jgi:hypothetical protein